MEAKKDEADIRLILRLWKRKYVYHINFGFKKWDIKNFLMERSRREGGFFERRLKLSLNRFRLLMSSGTIVELYQKYFFVE